MKKGSKFSQTTSRNCSLEGYKSTNLPLSSSHHDVDYRDDDDLMFMVGTQFNVTIVFLLDQIKVVKKLFWVA
jgi:hypothetical protein